MPTYYVSGRFYDQDGIYRVGDERYKQYNVRAKGNVRIRPWLRLNNNMEFAVVDYHQPCSITATSLSRV